MVVALRNVATISSWKLNLPNLRSACSANCGSDLENAHRASAVRKPVCCRRFRVGQVETQRAREAERHQLLLLAAGVVARVAVADQYEAGIDRQRWFAVHVDENWAWAYSFCTSQVLPAVSCQTIHGRFTG